MCLGEIKIDFFIVPGFLSPVPAHVSIRAGHAAILPNILEAMVAVKAIAFECLGRCAAFSCAGRCVSGIHCGKGL